MKRLILHDLAVAELDEAAAWYEGQRPGLGREFVAAVEQTVARAGDNPNAGSRYGRTDFRYFLVRRFPYLVVYRESETAVRVVAVAHASRKPAYWRNRDLG